jgi:aryl-alcohol dehydrogenase-like predicted oxidoreductase
MAKAFNMGVLPWSPLARGILTGEYHGENKADGGRMTTEEMKEFLPEEQRATRIVSAVKSVSEQNRPVAAWGKSHSPGCVIERCQ